MATPLAPVQDPNLSSTKLVNTPDNYMSLGLQPSEEAFMGVIIDNNRPGHKNGMNTPWLGGGGLKIEGGVGGGGG